MPDSTIAAVKGRRIWDSRGRPTVEAEVHLADGTVGRGIAPAGASRGSREAVDRRDGGERLRGLDVGGALAAIRDEIAPALRGTDATDQAALDARLITLDGTPTKARLGGNATVAVSLAALHAAAAQARLPLWSYLAAGAPVSIPMPEIQIFGGGAHAGRRIDIQDLMVVAPKAASFDEALEITAEVYGAAGRLMSERGALAGVADEGGWWPAFASNEEALDMLVRAIEAAGFTPGDEVAISLDIAASEFGRDGRYRLGLDGREFDSDGLCDLLLGWCARYPIVSIEDPLAEDDPEGLRRFTAAAGDRLQVIGDDFLVTNAVRVDAAARDGSVNAVLVKVNQAGTVTEAKAALDAGRRAGFGTIVSARSGETEDVAIAHLAVGWNAGQLKVGSFARSERMAKWNEVLRIADASQAPYAGVPRRFDRSDKLFGGADMSVFDHRFDGNQAVVTGGAQGIGFAIARRLAREGARLSLWDANREALEAAVADLGGATVDTVLVDITDAAAVEAAAARTAQAGAIDVLVHSAGIAGPAVPVVDYPLDAWRSVVDIDLTGAFHVNQAVVKRMVGAGYGRIVNIASIAGKEGNPNASAYSAAKAGLIALTKSLGKETAEQDIAVNVITPAAAKTRILEQVSQAHIDYMLSKIPRGRFVTVEEIAALVCFLASRENSFTTGAVFDISGGRAT